MSSRLFFLLLWMFVLIATDAFAQFEVKEITIKAGDNQELIDAINEANDTGVLVSITVVPNDEGSTEFVFEAPIEGTKNALPVITGRVHISNPGVRDGGPRITFRTSGTMSKEFRLMEIRGEVRYATRVNLEGLNIEEFGVSDGDGGAILVAGEGQLGGIDNEFRNNFAGGNGGAIALIDKGFTYMERQRFIENRASGNGGAMTIQGMAYGVVRWASFFENSAGVFGCAINLNATPDEEERGGSLDLSTSTLSSQCDKVLIENPVGKLVTFGNTISHSGEGVDSTDLVQMFGTVFNIGEAQTPGSSSPEWSSKKSKSKTQASCNDFGSGAFISDGYNLSTDGSCALDQDTDLPNTDPMLAASDLGLVMPQPDSPVIDAGGTDVVVTEQNPLGALPCDYVDLQGTARPQDGDGDGDFTCDMGAIEVLGPGAVTSGHSGAFFNASRNGEGQYIEILNSTTALVYTFTYRPDGSGPAWLLGVGEIRDNSIVIDQLNRPTGTSFGDDFDADEIEFSEAGGMSMVFPTCDAGGEGGGVAYSGEADIGYEGLLTRASRISNITGCGVTPTANAGLSGSFYDPARNGEGLIVEWLTNGDVLAIFFTFDQQGNQFWVFGLGTPVGKTVTINALYPAGSTQWGGNFDPSDVDLQDWGTFTLTWTACDAMTFDYASSVAGYGSASRNYTRISNLMDTSCPAFP